MKQTMITKSVILLVVLSVVGSLNVRALEKDSVKNGRSFLSQVGIDVRPAYACSSFKDDVLRDMVQSEDAKKTRFAVSYHLKYSFSKSAATEGGRFFPGVYQGLGVSINDFANAKGLGTPIGLYLLQGAPVWRINDRLSLDYEWNFGFSMGWKSCREANDYSSIDARSNLIVGSKVNAYINLGLMLRWRVSDHWSITAGLDATHFSNGNTSFPNPGVNMCGVRVGVSRSFGTTFKKEYTMPDTTRLKHRFSYDLTAYGAWRKRVYRGGEKPVLLQGHFPVAGFSFAPMYEVAKIFRAGLSADFQWDESTDLRRHYAEGSDYYDLRFYRPPFISQVCAGVAARAELVMPYFSVNCGIGYNFVGPEETCASYQMANLKIYVTKGLYLNIGYQLLDFSKQNNLMLGLGYTFRSNRPSGTTIVSSSSF